MLQRRGRSRHHLQVNADINLVNLVDLAFVLLIIFIITAPILQSGIEIQLPRAAAAPLTADEGVIVTIDKTGKIYIGDVRVQSLEEFERIFPSHMKARGKKEAYVKGDADVPYGKVIELIGLMKKLDVAEVGLVAEQENQR